MDGRKRQMRACGYLGRISRSNHLRERGENRDIVSVLICSKPKPSFCFLPQGKVIRTLPKMKCSASSVSTAPDGGRTLFRVETHIVCKPVAPQRL